MTRPRFIAGAVCPACGAMDRLQLHPAEGRRRCVACGYEDGRPAAGPAPRSRLDAHRRPGHRAPVDARPVRVVNPGGGPESAGE